jgi:endogenous inhibitor of DNA gyrase (YacG/DUF329 family)
MSRCPICGHAADARPQNKSLPFCSTRCKAIDLGKWLDEKYRVPAPEEPESDPDQQEKA